MRARGHRVVMLVAAISLLLPTWQTCTASEMMLKWVPLLLFDLLQIPRTVRIGTDRWSIYGLVQRVGCNQPAGRPTYTWMLMLYAFRLHSDGWSLILQCSPLHLVDQMHDVTCPIPRWLRKNCYSELVFRINSRWPSLSILMLDVVAFTSLEARCQLYTSEIIWIFLLKRDKKKC